VGLRQGAESSQSATGGAAVGGASGVELHRPWEHPSSHVWHDMTQHMHTPKRMGCAALPTLKRAHRFNLR